MTRMTMKIDGMSCGHCVSAVDRALKGVNGVTVEQVAIGSATVSFDPAKTPADRITQAVEDEGYAVADTKR
ncbi:MAG TPA: cation transporter [Gemmatimonadaceae bacterium]|nr:cation transporter [Gemmatimonadaceae bacterium]